MNNEIEKLIEDSGFKYERGTLICSYIKGYHKIEYCPHNGNFELFYKNKSISNYKNITAEKVVDILDWLVNKEKHGDKYEKYGYSYYGIVNGVKIYQKNINHQQRQIEELLKKKDMYVLTEEETQLNIYNWLRPWNRVYFLIADYTPEKILLLEQFLYEE